MASDFTLRMGDHPVEGTIEPVLVFESTLLGHGRLLTINIITDHGTIRESVSFQVPDIAKELRLGCWGTDSYYLESVKSGVKYPEV